MLIFVSGNFISTWYKLIRFLLTKPISKYYPYPQFSRRSWGMKTAKHLLSGHSIQRQLASGYPHCCHSIIYLPVEAWWPPKNPRNAPFPALGQSLRLGHKKALCSQSSSVGVWSLLYKRLYSTLWKAAIHWNSLSRDRGKCPSNTQVYESILLPAPLLEACLSCFQKCQEGLKHTKKRREIPGIILLLSHLSFLHWEASLPRM